MYNFNDEILLKLFSYFSIPDLNSLDLVSKQWNAIAKSKELWVYLTKQVPDSHHTYVNSAFGKQALQLGLMTLEQLTQIACEHLDILLLKNGLYALKEKWITPAHIINSLSSDELSTLLSDDTLKLLRAGLLTVKKITFLSKLSPTASQVQSNLRRRNKTHRIVEEPIQANLEASIQIPHRITYTNNLNTIHQEEDEFPYTPSSETTPLLKLTAKSQKFLTALDLTANDLQTVGIQLNEIERLLNQPIFAKVLTILLDMTSLTFIYKLTFALLLRESDLIKDLHVPQRKCASAKPLWLQGEGIPLTVKTAIRKTYGIEGFYEGLELFEKVWKGFLTYLIINDLVRTLQSHCAIDVFTILNNVLVRYEDVLGASLAHTTVWPFLVGIPLLTGTYYAYQEQKHAKHLNTKAIRKTMKQLLAHKTNRWNDIGRWLLSPFNFEAFPYLGVNVIFALLPYPKIKEKLDSIAHTLRWNARIPMATQLELFELFRKFAHRSTAITHWESLNTLAQIATSLGKHDFLRLHRLGTSQDEIIALLTIKTEALRELCYFASFPHRKSLASYTYAHYLLWRQGQPQTIGLQPLFFIYEGVKLYFLYALFRAIYDNIHEAISHHIEQTACESKGNKWLYIPHSDQFECSLCGDLPLFYNDIFTTEDCVRGFLSLPWALDDLLAFANDKRYNFTAITTLDLSRQKLAAGELAYFLDTICPKVLALQSLILTNKPHDLGSQTSIEKYNFNRYEKILARNRNDLFAICRCLRILPITYLDMENNFFIEPGDVGYFINNFGFELSISSVKTFNWNYGNLAEYAENFVDNFENHVMNHLYLANNKINIKGIEHLAKILTYNNITTLDISGNCEQIMEGDKCVKALTEYLPASNIHTLYLEGFSDDNGNNTQALVAAIQQSHTLRSLTYSSDTLLAEQIDNLGSAIQNSELEEICFFINYANLLLQTLPHSQLIKAEITSLDNNFEYISPILFKKILVDTYLTDLLLGGFNLTNTLKESIKSFTKSRIKILNLSDNHYSKEDELALLQALPNTSIETFTFLIRHTEGIKLFAQNLSKDSPLKILDLTINGFNASHVLPLFEKLNQSQIQVLHLTCFKGFNWSNCHVDSENIQNLVKNLVGSNVQDLALVDFQINDEGAKVLAKGLTTAVTCDIENPLAKSDPMIQKELTKAMPRTNLTSLSLVYNGITDVGAQALCNVLPQTRIAIDDLDLSDNLINEINLKTCLPHRPISYPSSANKNYPFGFLELLQNFYSSTLYHTNTTYQRLRDYLQKSQTYNPPLVVTKLLESHEISPVIYLKQANSNKTQLFYKGANKFLFFNTITGTILSNMTALSLMPSTQLGNNHNSVYRPVETNTWVFAFLTAGSAFIAISLILLVNYLGRFNNENSNISYPRHKKF